MLRNDALHRFALSFSTFCALIATVYSAEWPTLRHDQRRSGVTDESLSVTQFRNVWTWKSPLPPAPAWPDSARWDAYAKLSGLRSMRDYDPVFHPIASEQFVYFASNADDTVRCLEIASGDLIWQFTADAPVRVAPTLFDGILYFGSDDGCVYALEATTGDLNWRTELSPDSGCFVNDGRLCSRQPVRTGVIIDEKQGVAIAGCGMFPWKSTFLKALDLKDGSIAWESDLGTGWTIEGGMLLSDGHIIAPQGRSPPQLFDRTTGKSNGAVSGGGGSFVLLTEDQELMHGPGNKQGWITTSSTENRQKIASFEGGSSVVIVDRVAFLLTPQNLTAVDRDSQQPVWKIRLDRPQEIVGTQGHILVGGDGYVLAVDQQNGKLQWLQSVNGKAVGIAVAGKSIIASTDRGEVTVFAERNSDAGEAKGSDIDPAAGELAGYESLPIDVEISASGEPEPPAYLDETSSVFHWAFQENRTTAAGDRAIALESLLEGGVPVTLPKNSSFVQVGADHALVLDDVTQATVVSDFKNAKLPKRDFTIQATVRLDRTQAWGGLLSAMQDNGSYEKGWILGFKGDKFGVAVNGKEGPDRLTWVTAKEAVQPERWYHLAATYDGQQLKLFVNGKLSATSNEQLGDIEYPEFAGVELGAYKDKDEFFPTYGRINEVALLNRALSEQEIQNHFQSRQEVLGAEEFQERPEAPVETDPQLERDPNAYEIAIGPELRFVRPGTARVTWITGEPIACEIEIVSGRGEARCIEEESTQEIHQWEIAGLGRNELVEFQIRTADGQLSRVYECDSHFDYSRPALPEVESGESLQLATSIREHLPTDQARGIALVLGDPQAKLSEALAVRSGYDVIALSPANAVMAARRRLLATGTYGRPVSLVANERLKGFPYDFANFIVCRASETVGEQGEESEDVSWTWVQEVERLVSVLKPGGYLVAPAGKLSKSKADVLGMKLVESSAEIEGTAYSVWQRNRTPGAASWTHMYGQPDNSAYSGEALREADSADDLELTWCGRPGPRYQSDRGNRKPSPLAAGGRLYLQGLHRLIALDAHNGTILWNHELPEVVRFNVPRDCSNWCADDEAVYLSIRDRCRVIDGATGETIVDHPVYNPTDRDMHWGFVARHEDLLLGSCVQAGSHFDGFWGGEHWYDSQDGEHAKKVCSDALFAQEPRSGSLRWTYRNGLIINPTICVAEDRVIFIESRSKELIAGKTRRLDGDEFWKDQWVVALDVQTGEKIWERRAKPIPGVTAFYGVLSKDRYLIQSSSGGEFALYSMSVANGDMQWRGKYKWEVDHHGKHLSRPAIIGQKVFLRPFTIDLASGKVLADKFPTGHQCGTYTASKNALFLRAGSLAMWDGKSTAATRWNRVRPDCWISTIPAEGMLLSPEGGGGCSCGGWIETSMAFSPKPRMDVVSEPSN
jgi:outer membrane protein assembly factor BamB